MNRRNLLLVLALALAAWLVLLAVGFGVREAFAWPHFDRPGYHHCPMRAKIGPGDCHEGGASELSAGDQVLEGLDPSLRRDFEHWLHPHRHRDRECERLHGDYFLRHGFGRAPDVHGHGCRLWRNDEQWHAHHGQTAGELVAPFAVV